VGCPYVIRPILVQAPEANTISLSRRDSDINVGKLQEPSIMNIIQEHDDGRLSIISMLFLEKFFTEKNQYEEDTVAQSGTEGSASPRSAVWGSRLPEQLGLQLGQREQFVRE